MQRKNGPWTIKNTVQQYQNGFITVVEDQVIQPDGQAGTYSTVVMKPGVTILPLDQEDNVYLVRQFRYGLGKDSLEVVTGALDVERDEPVLEAAQRELQEEVGISAAEWKTLGVFDLDTSIVHCPVHLFLARQLSFVDTDREATETIETCKMPLQQAVSRVMDSTITHAPSCILILKAWRLLASESVG